MPSTITTPDGTYTITYETTSGGYTGRIAKIVYPSGASLAYTYTGGSNNSGLTCGSGTAVMVPILTRTLTDTTGAQHTWKYDTTQAANETVVTDPAGNDTVYLFYTYTGTGGAIKGEYETQRQIYQGSHTSGTLLKTVLTCYNTNTTNCPNPSSLVPPFTQKDVYTTLSGMTQSSHSETKYNNVGNLTEDTEYDFTGTLISDRVITYGTYSNGTCTNPIGTHILNRVCTDLTQVGTTPVSQTNNSYDSYGNLLSSSHWARGSTGSGGTYLTSSSTYNSNGTVNVATDVNGAQTTYGNYTCNGNFPTGISEPLSLSRSMTWDCVGGVVTSITDENSQKTTYGYVNPTTGLADPYYRPLSVTDPLNNVTNYTYSPTTFEAAMNFNGTVSTSDSLTTTDGFGHMLFAQTRKGQGSTTPFDTTQYTYDSDFRLYSTSIPCVAAAGSPCSTAVTTSTYDGLSRPHVTQDGGGGTATTTYPQNDVLTVLGPPPAAEDAKSHQYEYDGIGRLTSVCEILTTGGTSCGQNTSASGYKTSYAYSVPAAGGSQMVVNQGTQTRTYVYDGLSRLISETNPESGTTNYTYDSGASSACTAGYSSAGDLLQKIDANGNSTCYYYDSLHRVTDETTNQSGGYCRRFRYDNTTGVTGTIPSGITISNSLTRVAEAETDNCSLPITPITDEWFSYSVRGENTDVYESTPHSGSPYYHTTASYWANGALESLTGVPGYTGLSYGVDGEGRLNTAQQGTSKIVCDTVPCGIASTTFDPAGNPLVVNIGGTADNDTYVYDPNTERMTSYTFTVGSTPASIAGALNWNQNGTLRQLAITDGFNSGGAQTCNYGTASPPVMGYDDLGRLLNVSCGSLWAQAFSYDQFGNISKTGSLTWACPTCYNGNNQYNSTLSASVSYDSDGNLLNDTFHKYTWDVYGHPSTIGGATGSITCGTSGTCLTYDANGHMVEKNVSGVFTEILYSPVGKTATMSGQSTTDAYFSLPAGETLYETGSTGGNRFFWHKD
jgi:YD repeat-containing protein